MKMKIVGVQKQSYKLDNGYSFDGLKVHAVDLDTKPDGLQGNIAASFKIPSNSPCYGMDLKVGETYNVYFTQKGAVDALMLVSERK